MKYSIDERILGEYLMRRHQKEKMPTNKAIFVTVVFVLVGLCAAYYKQWGLSIVLMLAVLVYILFDHNSIKMLVSRRLHAKTYMGDYLLDINNEGMKLSDGESVFTMPWSSIAKISKLDSFYYIENRMGFVFFFPGGTLTESESILLSGHS